LPARSEFGNAAWSEAKARALARLRGAGYATAGWTGTAAEVDRARNEVRLFLSIDSGPLFRLGRLEIDGLATHDADTVRDLLAAPLGAPVTEALILDFQERLQKAGLFESVSVTLDTDPAQADAAGLLVRLREAPLQMWTFGLGVSANTGPRGTVEHVYRRVFGTPLTSRNKVELGTKRQAWDGEISTHPGPGFYRNLIGGAVENLETDSDTVLAQRVRLGRTQDTTRIERLYYLEYERSLRETTLGARTNAVAVSFNYHGVWRDLDSVVLPTRGFSFSGQGGVGRSHGTNADTGFFTRWYARLTGYLPLGQSWYGQARVELGRVFLPGNVVVPESQRFRAGGDDSVRGYTYKSLGPIVDGVVGGGNVLFTSSVELARPISRNLPSLWGAVFVDAGNAADTPSALRPAWGAGVGIRWRSPVGPLRLDWAYGRELRKSRLHFSVGIAF
jgi:translocation and assembly module TamA